MVDWLLNLRCQFVLCWSC